MNDSALQIVIRAINEATATFAEVDSQVKGLGKSTQSTTGSMSASFESAGASVSKLGSALMPMALGAGVALGVSAKAAIDFQQKMELVATQAGASQQEVDGLKESVLALAPTVGQGPAKLADALFYVESAGFRGAQAMDILKLAAEGADVGQADLAQTANALTSVMNTQIQGAQTASEAMGNLNAIVGAGKMHFEDLNAAIGTGFVNTAHLFGVSLDSVGAALDQLTKNGEPAANAATRLSMMITLMGAPTNQAAKVLSGIGLSANEVQASTSAMTDALAAAHVTTNRLADDMRQPNGILVAIQDLKDHLKAAGMNSEDAAAVIARAFGGGRTSKPIQALVQDTQGLSDTFNQIQQTAGNFGDSWAKQQETANQKMQDFKAQLEVLSVHLGNAFLPTLERLAKDLGGIADWFSRLSPQTEDMIAKILLFTVALAPVLKITGELMSVGGGLVKVFGGIAGALGGAEGVAAAAGAAAPELAGLGAILTGPVGIAIAASAVAVGGLAYGVYQLTKSHDAASSAAKGQAGSESMLTLFQDAQKKATDNQKRAAVQLQQAQDAMKPSNANLTQANKDIATAQAGVQDALKKFGQNSPQYKAATDNLTTAEQAYRDIVHDASDKTLTLMGAQLKAHDTADALRSATSTLNSYLWDQNKNLGDIVHTIATMGPTATLQVQSIANLGQVISDVVAKFHVAQNDIQGGIASDIGNFQGLGSTIDRLQNAATNLQKTAGGTSIQGGTPGNIQGNYGTAPVKGVYQQHASGGKLGEGWNMINEEGPELLFKSGGDVQVYPAGQTKSMLKGSGGVTINQTNHNYSQFDLKTANAELGYQLATRTA